jgi:hypothetical protein
MLRKSIQSSAQEPSFFYLMMAESCFLRAASTRNPKACGTLRELGRKYLADATNPRPPTARRGELSCWRALQHPAIQHYSRKTERSSVSLRVTPRWLPCGMMDVENFNGVARHLVKYLVRETNKRDHANPRPLLNLFRAFWPAADASQYGP